MTYVLLTNMPSSVYVQNKSVFGFQNHRQPCYTLKKQLDCTDPSHGIGDSCLSILLTTY